MGYSNETEMYSPVKEWLHRTLSDQWVDAEILTFDTHSKRLCDFISENALEDYVNDEAFSSYEIQVDVTGFIKGPKVSGLVFVECKITNASLRDLGQILGYSRVARPLKSYLLSSSGITGALKSLIEIYGRRDILEYHTDEGEQPRRIQVYKWNSTSENLDHGSYLS